MKRSRPSDSWWYNALLILSIALAVLGLCLSKAEARGWTVQHYYGGGYYSTYVTRLDGVSTNIRDVPAYRDPESPAREKAWEERCRPVLTVDDLGVGRLQYAAPSCDVGKWRD